MSNKNNDQYEKARKRVVNFLFGHPTIGVILAALIVVFVAVDFLLDFFEKSEKRLTPRSYLEIVEILPIETDGFPILDIKMRNPSDSVVYLKAIDFEVLKSEPEYVGPHMSAGVPVSEQYNIMLDPTAQGYIERLSVSQEIPKDGTDRISVIVGAIPGSRPVEEHRDDLTTSPAAPGMWGSGFRGPHHIHSATMHLRLRLHYNEGDSVTSPVVPINVVVHDYFESPARLVGASLTERLAALQHGSLATRYSMARFLGDVRERRAIPYLFQRLEDENQKVVGIAAISLAKLQAPNSLSTFQGLLADKHSSDEVRIQVVQAIGHLDDPRGPVVLKNAFPQGEWWLRLHIIRSLKQLGKTDLNELFPYAAQALETDSSPTFAADVLAELGDSRAIPPLRRAYCREGLRDFQREHIREVLFRFGEYDPIACVPSEVQEEQ